MFSYLCLCIFVLVSGVQNVYVCIYIYIISLRCIFFKCNMEEYNRMYYQGRLWNSFWKSVRLR